MIKDLPPKYWDYKGGYDNVNYCTECGLQGLYEDLHSVNPCPQCGGQIVDYDRVGKWIKPVYRTKFLIFKEKIKDGYWFIKEK